MYTTVWVRALAGSSCCVLVRAVGTSHWSVITSLTKKVHGLQIKYAMHYAMHKVTFEALETQNENSENIFFIYIGSKKESRLRWITGECPPPPPRGGIPKFYNLRVEKEDLAPVG